MNHTEPECFRPGGPLHKARQKDQEKKKKKKKDEKANAAKADKSASETDSSSHNTAAVFLQWPSQTYAKHANQNITFDYSDYSMVAQANPLRLVNHHPCATRTEDHPYHMDSGATLHCTPHREDFVEFTPIKPCAIWGVDGTCISAIGIGKIKLHLGKSRWLTLRDTLFTPQAALCLISVGHLADEGLACIFEKGGCTIHNPAGKTLVEGALKESGLYTLKGKQP